MLSLAVSGYLYSIDLRTGVATKVGATGLDDCSTPSSPCGQKSPPLMMAISSSKILRTRLQPESVFPGPGNGSHEADWTYRHSRHHNCAWHNRFCWEAQSVLREYVQLPRKALRQISILASLIFQWARPTAVIPAALYEIDPETGAGTMIAPTDVGLLTIVNVNETIYAFDAAHRRFVTLDLKTGQTEAIEQYRSIGRAGA